MVICVTRSTGPKSNAYQATPLAIRLLRQCNNKNINFISQHKCNLPDTISRSFMMNVVHLKSSQLFTENVDKVDLFVKGCGYQKTRAITSIDKITPNYQFVA